MEQHPFNSIDSAMSDKKNPSCGEDTSVIDLLSTISAVRKSHEDNLRKAAEEERRRINEEYKRKAAEEARKQEIERQISGFSLANRLYWSMSDFKDSRYFEPFLRYLFIGLYVAIVIYFIVMYGINYEGDFSLSGAILGFVLKSIPLLLISAFVWFNIVFAGYILGGILLSIILLILSLLDVIIRFVLRRTRL